MFIEVNKITNDENNKPKVKEEVIRIDRIISYRDFHRNGTLKSIDGDIIIIKLAPENDEDTFRDIKVNESAKSFSERLGCVKTLKQTPSST